MTTADATDFAHLAGHEFPGGRYSLPPYESWLWADAVEAVPDGGFAHPEIAYMIGLHGGGASIGDLMRLLEADEDSGVLFGEVEFEFSEPLRPGATYDVRGRVVSVERKQGRRSGAFDRAIFEHELFAVDGGGRVARVLHVWIFPRKGDA